MSLFERIEPEPPGSEEQWNPVHRSSRRFDPEEPLTVAYRVAMKVLILLSPLIILPFFLLFLEEGVFFLEIVCVLALVYCCWVGFDCLQTRSFTFYPDRIVKYGWFQQSEIPTSALVMRVKEQNVTLYHGSDKNLRESMLIRRFLIAETDLADLAGYLEDCYGVSTKEMWERGYPEWKPASSELAVREFCQAASNYRLIAAFFAILPLIAFFTVGISDTFYGFAPETYANVSRLACIGLAIAAFFLVRHWTRVPMQVRSFDLVSVTTRLARADGYAFRCASLSALVAAMGLVLLLCFGNTLDLYLFLMVGWLYFYDCYPRLSTWERLAFNHREAVSELSRLLPRRSLQVSVVLMGALAAMSYGESRHYLYASLKDCRDDWGDGKDCREEPTGGSGGSGSGGVRYYGPRYGSGGGSPTRAIGVSSVSRGGFGSLGRFHASFGG